jgi:predicted nucleic acid-binding protein
MVVDAPALLEYLLGTDLGKRVGTKLRASHTALDTPALCDLEIVSGLRRAVLKGEMTGGRAAEALTDYEDFPIRLHRHRQMLWRIFELRNNFSAYDAAYVALAEHLGAGLLTADERLAR